MIIYKLVNNKGINNKAWNFLQRAHGASISMSSNDAKFYLNDRKDYVCIRLYDNPNPKTNGGILLQEGQNIYIAHTGNFSIKTSGIRDAYLQNTKHKKVSFDWQGKTYEAVLIGLVDEPHFSKKLERFIIEVLNIKAAYSDEYGITEKEKKQIDRIRKSKKITKTVRLALCASRIGHGQFREDVLSIQSECLFTGIAEPALLIAGHIKPWVESNDKEKLDPLNGLTLTPTYDRLFDRFLISFDKNRKLLVSKKIHISICEKLNLQAEKEYSIYDCLKREKYFAFHRDRFLKENS